MLSPGAEDSIEKVKIEKLCAKSLPVKKIEIRNRIMTKTAMTATRINILVLRSFRAEVFADLLAFVILSDTPAGRGLDSPLDALFFAFALFRMGIFFG
jgi:hypothetical protein